MNQIETDYENNADDDDNDALITQQKYNGVILGIEKSSFSGSDPILDKYKTLNLEALKIFLL